MLVPSLQIVDSAPTRELKINILGFTSRYIEHQDALTRELNATHLLILTSGQIASETP